MGVEIERKFLVDSSKLPSNLGNGRRIRQGYLSSGIPVVRIRIYDEARAELTIKGPGLLTRAEYNYPIPLLDARQLWLLAKSTIDKTRYYIEAGDFMWEVDRFNVPGGFWLAEIELPSETAEFERPDWLWQEVTHDPRYTNQALAERFPNL